MTTLADLESDLQDLSAQLLVLAGAPSVPFGPADIPSISAASADATNAAAHIHGLGGSSSSPTSKIDSCDHEVSVALAMVKAVNGGLPPASLSSDGILTQVGTACTMAIAII